ncbi:HAD family hydrolase [Sinirhodobacter ferrireducens]|uniref:phosphoglycolate phosphatase n=1 Tax=Paenirhodobacter ferrireducens TaxID=1215032 RepID=A0A443LJJ4_9RHOB|nr:HAD-IA family hydrolase [Sinirhodobacter ferrireducens]RWR49346.1 HAD family hydrolase [Sinirhodobacter ferrireducens]
MGTITGLLFDKDGTLFDFDATWGAWAQGMAFELAEGDPALAGRLAAAIGFDLRAARFERASPVIAGTVAEVAELMLPLLPRHDLQSLVATLDLGAQRAPQVPAADLPACLGGLKARGMRLGVATNDAEASARVHLQKAGVGAFFDYVAGYDSGHGAKPGAGPLLAFATAFALAPASVAMVGDSLHDMAAARAAGMRAVAVLSGPATRADLAGAADVVLDTIAELPDWLDAGAP